MIPQVVDMKCHKSNFKRDNVPLKYEILNIWNQKSIVDEKTIEPDRYYPSWLEDDITEIVKLVVKLKGRIIYEDAEAQVQ